MSKLSRGFEVTTERRETMRSRYATLGNSTYGDVIPAGPVRGEDKVPPGTFHGGDEVPPGTFHGGDEVPAGTFH